MVIKKQDVVKKIVDYLQHKITLSELVDWAETVMMEAEFEKGHHNKIRDVVSCLGLADVRAFGLSWEDSEKMLNTLGYRTSIEVAESET